MAGIVMPAQRQQVTQGQEGGGKWGRNIGAVIGGVAGAFGGPGAAVQGAVAGASTGQFLGDWARPGRAGTITQAQGPSPVAVGSGTGALDRRMEQLRASSPQMALADAHTALKELPLDLQKEYAPIIQEALKQSQQPRTRGFA